MTDVKLVDAVQLKTLAMAKASSEYWLTQSPSRVHPERTKAERVEAAMHGVGVAMEELRGVVSPRLDALAVGLLHSAPGEWGVRFLDEISRVYLDNGHRHAMSRRLQQLGQLLALVRAAGAMGVPHSGSAKRPGRKSSGETDADAKTLAVLTAWHEYENGSVMNFVPATNRGLAVFCEGNLSPNALTRFFRDKGGVKAYKVACRNKTIGALLAKWNGELSGHHAKLHKEEAEMQDRKGGRRRGRAPGSHKDD